MAQGGRLRSALRWCHRCGVGWAPVNGWTCWSCGQRTWSDLTITWTSGEGGWLATHLLAEVGPDRYAPDMFGEALTQPGAVLQSAA